MKRTRKILPPEQTAAELAHFVWCALIALRTAQQDGQALVPLTIHTFLLRWLAGAQKQRRFPRSVAAELDRLLSLGRQKGPAAGLEQRLEYLLNSCGNPVMQQSDMFRLTNAIEHLKSQGWVNAVVTDEEWQPQMLFAEYAGTDVLLTRKSELECRFEVSGRLTGSIEFMVVGNNRVVMDVLNARGFDCVLHEQHDGGCLLLLLPPEGTPADVQTVL
uniref:Protein of uncharacterized function (DUF2913) n=1 Tax=Klebsiella pneumoniae TaxID=573 RepID=A0A486VZ42_KLEPN|nr:Protein of uncharacterised function (DUF2913) [Klebsiella pneumoniae]